MPVVILTSSNEDRDLIDGYVPLDFARMIARPLPDCRPPDWRAYATVAL
jgi:hypothetical protein